MSVSPCMIQDGMSIDWRKLQASLGVTPDGIAGRNTFAALFRKVAVIGNARAIDQSIINSLANAAVVHFPEYGITDNVDRLVDWLSQTCNETGGYTTFSENLNYSVAGMLATWPRHFNQSLAEWAKGSPERVAEVAYGVKSRQGVGRMGNTLPGWGYLYRGRGMLQLTGRDGYVATDKRLGLGLDTNPEIAAVPALSLLVACDFYKANEVLQACDTKDFTKARRLTNGGSIGLDHVNALRAKIGALFA